MADHRPPPVDGDWHREALGNTGDWSVGGVWIDRVGHRYGMWIEPRHCNAFGAMHGGAMATFADAQIAAVRSISRDPAEHTPTVTLTIDYLAPARVGAWLMLAGEVLRATATLIFTQGLVTADGEPAARTSAIYRTPRKDRTP